LFCFPYAGGSASAYNKWRHFLDRQIELQPVELSGRGRRIYEPLYDSVEDAVNDVYSMINGQLSGIPYALYGHSMGGMIAYELAYRIRENNLTQPLHIFFSGRGAPDIPYEDEEIFHTMPEEEFKEKVLQLGGTPKEFFDHPELLEVLLPTLRSDFKVAETYEHNSEVIPFDHDISVLIGKDEEVSAEQMHGWRKHTKKVCHLYYFEGEHFFIHEETEKVVSILNHNLLQAYRSLKSSPSL
jgi:surfactin synthase thioesterase subunit